MSIPHSAQRQPDRQPSAWHGQGFSLIELMVGLVIGMATILVIMQVFTLSEGSRRTGVGGDDAQTSGAIALSSLQRDIRQGGYGLSRFRLIGCNLLLPAGWTVAAMAPVTINPPDIPAGDADTDTVRVAYGNSASASPDGVRISAQPGTPVYVVSTVPAFARTDQVIAVAPTRPTPCNLTLEPVVLDTAANPVTVGSGVAGVTGGLLFNLGPRPQILAYAVRGGNLTVCDYWVHDCSAAADTTNPAVWTPIGSRVVSLRAQYGRDTTAAPMDAIVDVFDQATPNTACGWARVFALRVVLVARSAQFDKAVVTRSAPTWSGSAAQPVTLSGIADWQHYRYKSYETTVPLRNMVWQGAQPGC